MGRQAFHRFHELRAFGLHDEGDGIPMGATAEAVEMIIIDVEGGGFFPMKRAAALPVATGFEQPRLPSDQTGQGRAGAKLIKETGGQGHGEGVGYTFGGMLSEGSAREKIPLLTRKRSSNWEVGFSSNHLESLFQTLFGTRALSSIR